jgi:serine/threonine protein kinase/uncharacterized Zn finger protein (UPF0148 family)
MVLEDDNEKDPQEPLHQPELPGITDLSPPRGQANVPAEFQAKGGTSEQDVSVVIDLPSVKVVTPEARVEESDPYLGRVFGNYELVAKIGQGGMGLVYKGRQVSLDRVVAVKILNKSLCDNQEFIKRFEREAKSVARINHPNIMAVYDFGQTTDGIWYMVVEFIEGHSLSKAIADKLMLPVEELAPILIQCLAGLAHVSTSGIVHRDIKPDNILITRDSIAKIADFGLAKDVSRNDHTDLTTAGLAMGTPAYMSPEQCMGRRLDGRSDIYALGVTAYLALTGEKPFVGQSSFEVMTKQREFTPPPPRQLNPAIPKEVSELVMRMLAKNPHDRFADAETCRQAWQELGLRLGFLRGQHLASDARSVPPTKAPPPQPPPGTVPAALPVAAPLGGVPMAAAVPPPIPVAPSMLPPLRATADLAAPGMSEAKKSRTSGEFAAPPEASAHGSQRSTSTRQVPSRTLSGGEAATCPKCGMLNRAEQVACARCGHELRTDADASRSQEAEAQRLFNIGQYKDAAALYARLADREQDRRARAILRTREREARTLEHQQQVNGLQNMTKDMVNRGDLKGGIQVLERGLRDVRDAGASSTGAETKLKDEINSLRVRLKWRQRRRIMLVVAVVLLLVVAAVAAKVVLFPAAAATPVVAPPPQGP